MQAAPSQAAMHDVSTAATNDSCAARLFVYPLPSTYRRTSARVQKCANETFDAKLEGLPDGMHQLVLSSIDMYGSILHSCSLFSLWRVQCACVAGMGSASCSTSVRSGTAAAPTTSRTPTSFGWLPSIRKSLPRRRADQTSPVQSSRLGRSCTRQRSSNGSRGRRLAHWQHAVAPTTSSSHRASARRGRRPRSASSLSSTCGGEPPHGMRSRSGRLSVPSPASTSRSASSDPPRSQAGCSSAQSLPSRHGGHRIHARCWSAPRSRVTAAPSS